MPAALVGLAAAAGSDGRIYLLGGSGPVGFSAQVYAFDPATDSVTVAGGLPQALHDAGAAWEGSRVLVCGGGQAVGTASIWALSPGPGEMARVAGRLPVPLSDLSGVTVRGRPYCLGGWTGQAYSDAVLDVGAPTGAADAAPVVAHLPHAVRYAAVAALPGGALVAGGRTASGNPTDAIQWVPLGGALGTAPPAQVGHLPSPTAYAMAATVGGTVILAGGCDASGAPTETITALDAQGSTTPVGALPTPLCYGAAAAAGGAVYLFGGRTGMDDATATAHVWKLTPVYGG